MQNKVQLYIKNDSGDYDRVDLYSDETIELTSKIQDLRDIGKIFTDFTQSFNVPASDTNNKIFRHFYNFNITGGAFDSRKKREAIIQNHPKLRFETYKSYVKYMNHIINCKKGVYSTYP